MFYEIGHLITGEKKMSRHGVVVFLRAVTECYVLEPPKEKMRKRQM